jgi:N-succinyldiaminopimelate aminotransferase
VHVPQGTYFVTTDVSSLGHADGKAFCAATAERARVVAIPNQVFYEDGSAEGRHLIRWAFCKELDVLEEGIRRLRATDLRA